MLCTPAPAGAVGSETAVTGVSAPWPSVDPTAIAAPAHPTRVAASARLLEIDRISDAADPDASFSASYWIELRWSDPRLAFDGSQSKSFVQDNARGELERIWQPGIDIEYEDGEREMESALLTIAPDGAVSYQETFKARISANFDLRAFPFDLQHLTMGIISDWGENDLRFEALPVASSEREVTHPSEWRPGPISTRAERRVDNDGSTGSAFVLDVAVRRDGTYYLIKLILPLVVVVMLSWANFWITGRGDGRIRLTFLCLLAVIAYENVLSRFLPRRTFLTFLDWVILASMASLAMTVVENAWVHALLQRGDAVAAERIDSLASRIVPATVILGVAIIAVAQFG
jgi:hypothetical protein